MILKDYSQYKCDIPNEEAEDRRFARGFITATILLSPFYIWLSYMIF